MNFPKIFKILEPETLKNLSILFITGLLFWTSITTLLSTLPAYIEDVGGTKQQVGTVMGAFAIGLLASRTWLGNVADRRSRKLVILIGTIVAGIAPLGYLAVHSILPLMAIRAFHGISIAAFSTGYSALVVDLSPAKQRGEIIGYMSLVVSIGMAFGPALGSYLQESVGYPPLFIVSALSGFLSLLLAYQVQEVDRQTALDTLNKTDALPERSFGQLFVNPAFFVPTSILFFIGILFGGLVTFLPLYMRERQLDFNAGLFYTNAAMASFVGRIIAGKASDRLGRGLFISGSLICYGASMLLLASARTEVELMLAAILEGAGGGILIPMLLALISDRSYVNERGRVYAICIGGFDVGIALAGPILGAINLSYQGIFAITSIFAVLALFLFLTCSNKNFIHSLRFAFGLEKDRYALDERY